MLQKFALFAALVVGRVTSEESNEESTIPVVKTDSSLLETVTLSNGVKMPKVGFGTAGGITKLEISYAFESGIHLIDSAQAAEWYSETQLGESVSVLDHAEEGMGIPNTISKDGFKPAITSREDLFLVSKLHPRDLGFVKTLKAFPNSLKSIRTRYMDAFLIHFPECFGDLCKETGTNNLYKQSEDGPKGTWKESWKAMEKLYGENWIRAIGVSNFDIEKLKDLVKTANVKPHIVQNHFDPFHQDREVRRFCKKHNIAYMGYSTLGSQWMSATGKSPVLLHPVIEEIASKYKQPAASIVLKWALQNDVIIIPRSKNLDRIHQNTVLGDWELSAEDVEKINNLDGTIPKDEDGKLHNQVTVFMTNTRDYDIAIYWVSPDINDPSRLKEVVTLKPADYVEQETFIGHEFMIFKADNSTEKIGSIVVEKEDVHRI